MIDKLVIRPFRLSDRPGVRLIYGDDEVARPTMNQHYPRYADAHRSQEFSETEPLSLLEIMSLQKTSSSFLPTVVPLSDGAKVSNNRGGTSMGGCMELAECCIRLSGNVGARLEGLPRQGGHLGSRTVTL
jgi:hypothetical protein